MLASLPGSAQRIVTSTDVGWMGPGFEGKRFRVVAGEVAEER